MKRYSQRLAATTAAFGITCGFALGITVAAANATAQTADFQIVNRATGQPAQTYTQNGRIFVAGAPGERYAVRVTNRTPTRILAVVSVDGVNVVTGETAAPNQNGYVLGPFQSYDIAGWRKNTNEIAAFYFTSLGDSYAARTERPANVGVIGLAAFREWQAPRPRPQPSPMPRSSAPEGRNDAPPAADPSGATGASGDSRASGASKAEPPAQPLTESSRESTRDSARVAPPPPATAQIDRERSERIGTGHGERVRSEVTLVDFRRATPYPAETRSIHYDTHSNLIARGIIPRSTVDSPQVGEPQPFPGMRFVPDPRG